CESTPDGMRGAILRILEDEALRLRLQRNARDWAVAHVSLQRIVELELAVLQELL
ncbi:MAG: hypothetical protein HQL94_09250, partial [Magnetococcales bacterium]|nr:hypothetical protein [Magnetococcales bacterium]